MPVSYSWLKLYYEIVDDPKMGRLPDRIWRRVIECFLLAGKNGNSGSLPDIGAMAWALRTTEQELEAELSQISQLGILEKAGGAWYVKNFVKRQSATPDAERMSQMRTRKRYEPVTARNVEERRGEERREEGEGEGAKSAPPPPAKLAPVVMLERLTGRKPSLKLYEFICDTLGAVPDEEKLKAVVTTWLARDYNPGNVAGILDWYKNGIPQNGRRKEEPPGQLNWTVEQAEAENIRLNAHLHKKKDEHLDDVPTY